MYSIVLLSFAAASMAAPSSPPVWPNGFTVNFTDVAAGLSGDSTTTGVMYYDASNSRSRVDRADGKGDRYCGSVKDEHTPCSQLVVNGERYMVYPALQYCCKCCSASSGCGIVSPDWLVKDNATYIGEMTINGEKGNAWDVQGLSKNIYVAKEDKDNSPLFLQQGSYENQTFFHFEKGQPSADLFTLPSYCSGSCPLLSICTIAREKEEERPGL